MAAAFVEQHREVAGVVQADTAAQGAHRGREARVPAGRALHTGGILDVPQQAVGLGVLARRVEAHDLVGGEVRASLAQHVEPRHDARTGQPGRAHRLREQRHPAVAGVADHCQAPAVRRRHGR